MQSVGLPAHVFAAAIERDLVLFDSAADRYVALPGAVSAHAGVTVTGLPDLVLIREAAELLLNAGMLIADPAAVQRSARCRGPAACSPRAWTDPRAPG